MKLNEETHPPILRCAFPRISVITPSFNHAEFISETIESVLSQDCPNLEYWVIDGGSTDDTISILERLDARVLWVSEKDEGQSDAVNKGFARATGEIIGWLNSDDTYLPGTLKYVGECFAARPDVDVLYGDGYYIDRDGKIVGPYLTRDFDWESFAHECYVCQPTVFFRRRVLQEVGMLHPKLHLCMDYDFWIRLFRRFPPLRVPRFLATSRMYPENKSLSVRSSVQQEIIQTVGKHYGYVPYNWALDYASYLWHRNVQYHDPRPVTLPVFLLALALMGWYNRFHPDYLWRWLTNKEFGIRSEMLKGVRRKQGRSDARESNRSGSST